MQPIDWRVCLLGALVLGLLVAIGYAVLKKGRGTPEQAAARAVLRGLETARSFDDDIRQRFVLELIEKGRIPDAQPGHEKPENFEALVRHVRSRA